MKRDFLFASWEGGGNIAPMLTLVRRLIARGHDVRILGDDASADAIARSGAEFVPWREAPNRPDQRPETDFMRDWEIGDPAALIQCLLDKLMVGPALGFARDVMAELSRRRADAVVSSDMLLGAMIGAEAMGVRQAILACNIPWLPRPGVPPFGPGLAPASGPEERAFHEAIGAATAPIFEAAAGPLNEARRACGLPPLPSFADQLLAPERHLVATAEAFDYPAREQPANLRYVGPLLDHPDWAGSWGGDFADPARPLVLVAFSTTFQDQLGACRRAAEALAGLPVNAAITTGPCIDPADIEGAPNLRIVRAAPHDAILARAALAVTHCGHGTLMRALSAGVPVLCLPMGRDQNDNAARTEWHGAGLRLDPSAAPDEIAAAARRLIEEPGFAAAARELGAAIRAETGPDRAAIELKRIAAAPEALRGAA